LKNGKYLYNGQTYSLPQHGFARSSMFEVGEVGVENAIFILRSNDQTRQNYPFDFELIISYYLIERGNKYKGVIIW